MDKLLKDMHVCETVITHLKINGEMFNDIYKQSDVAELAYTLYMDAIEAGIDLVRKNLNGLHKEYESLKDQKYATRDLVSGYLRLPSYEKRILYPK